MTIEANLQPTVLPVQPGADASMVLRIRNTGTTVDELVIRVLGDLGAHVGVATPAVRMFPGDDISVPLAVRVPRTAEVVAGVHPFAVHVTSSIDPSRIAIPEATIDVAPFQAVAMDVSPRTSRGSARAKHSVAITNTGNTPTMVRVQTHEADEVLGLAVANEAMRLGPGQSGRTEVVVRSLVKAPRGGERRAFQIIATPADGQPVTTEAAMNVQPGMPAWLPKALIAAGAAIALIAVLLATRSPKTTSAARDRAAPTVATTAVSKTTAVATTAPSTTAAVDGATTVAPAGGDTTIVDTAPPPVAPPLGNGTPTTRPPVTGGNVPVVQPPAPAPKVVPKVVGASSPAAVFLNLAAGTLTPVAGIDVGVGDWVITSQLAAIDFDAEDYVRCGLYNSTAQLDLTTTLIGGAATTPYGEITNMTTVSATAPTHIDLKCTHDRALPAGTRLYIDPAAHIVATPVSGVVQATLASNTNFSNPAVDIMSITVPAGTWALSSKATLVNYYTGDYLRCSLMSGATALDGGASFAGKVPTPTVVVTRNLAKLVATAPTKVTLRCGSDAAHPTPPYVDGGARLMAIPALEVVVATAPASVNLSPTPAIIASGAVGPGDWTVFDKATAVDFGAAAAVRCQTFVGGASVDSKVTFIDSYRPAEVLANTVSLNTATAATVDMRCGFDPAASPPQPTAYVDPGARVLAFRTT